MARNGMRAIVFSNSQRSAQPLESWNVTQPSENGTGECLGPYWEHWRNSEDKEFQQSSIAQRRQEALQRAEERKVQESQRLREIEIQNFQARKQAEIDKINELDLQTSLKELEISFLTRIRRHSLLQNFIRTQSSPPIHWLPLKHNAATKQLLQQETEKFKTWKEEELQRLEKEKQELRDKDAERRKQLAEAKAKPTGVNGVEPEPKSEPAEPSQAARSSAQVTEENPQDENAEEGELPYDAKTHAEEQTRIEEQIAAEEMAQDDEQDDELPDGINL